MNSIRTVLNTDNNEDVEAHQNIRVDTNWLSSSSSRDDVIVDELDKDGKTKNNSRFKGPGSRT
jgi:hypothetical protein